MARLHLRTSAHSAPGVTRARGDDACLVREYSSGTWLAVVADGVGSARAGGEAAHRAVEMLGDYFAARPTAWSPRRALLAFFRQINRQLFQEGIARHERPELVTTLTAVAIAEGRTYGASVGDSSVCLWRAGSLRLLTQPHRSSEPGEELALTQAIGLAEDLLPHAFELELMEGDRLLLCTDGVSEPLGRHGLRHLMERDAAARSFVTAARDAVPETEVPDDATAIVLEVASRDETMHPSQTLHVVEHLRAGDRFPDGKLERPLDVNERVWLAMSESGQRVLLKFPPLEAAKDEARADAFLQEAWQAARLDAPEFVRSRVPAHPALQYYQQDYEDAPTLAALLAKGPLPVETVIALATFLLRAAQLLAARDLAHGDLKPENVLVLRTIPAAEFRLIDLGSAAELFSITSRSGTPSYLAPERFQGAALSEGTEIYSLGVILYQCLTGRLPFGAIEPFQSPRFTAPPRGPAALNPATPAWLDAVVRRMVAVSPADRYTHYSEVLHELQNPLAVRPFQRPGAPLLERNPLLVYRLLCLLLLALNLWQWLGPRRGP